MLEDSTVKWMKTAGLLTKIADRDTRDTWEAHGAPDSHTKALQRARQILSRPNQAVFSAELDTRIRAEFPGLVPGEATLPAGW